MTSLRFAAAVLTCMAAAELSAQTTVTVRPAEIDDVLVNPGIGFMTFQRFNGDDLNEGLRWTEGFPIAYQEFKGSLKNRNHPDTSMAFFRVYWRYIEPNNGIFAWNLLDQALKTAHGRRQTLLIAIAPYGSSNEPKDDVPDWYRAMVGDEKGKLRDKWRTDAEDPRYARYFGRMIRAVASRYDGHPDLESVDMALVGAWGEGAGSEGLTEPTRRALVDPYVEGFRKTPLVMLLTDRKTNGYTLSRSPAGYRYACLGDMGGFTPHWNHMLDLYPQSIIGYGAADAWKTGPVSFEVCWVVQFWKDKGWDIDYIIDQSLKWHISSLNAKSSAVPAEWWPQVNRWLKKMGYRFVLRKFTYPAAVRPSGKLEFTSWWENRGVAPCYRHWPVALRLKGERRTKVFLTAADIRKWMPGDSVYDDAVFLPADMPPGQYELAIGLLDPQTRLPKLKLAIAGMDPDGWYPLGKIDVSE